MRQRVEFYKSLKIFDNELIDRDPQRFHSVFDEFFERYPCKVGDVIWDSGIKPEAGRFPTGLIIVKSGELLFEVYENPAHLAAAARARERLLEVAGRGLTKIGEVKSNWDDEEGEEEEKADPTVIKLDTVFGPDWDEHIKVGMGSYATSLGKNLSDNTSSKFSTKKKKNKTSRDIDAQSASLLMARAAGAHGVAIIGGAGRGGGLGAPSSPGESKPSSPAPQTNQLLAARGEPIKPAGLKKAPKGWSGDGTPPSDHTFSSGTSSPERGGGSSPESTKSGRVPTRTESLNMGALFETSAQPVTKAHPKRTAKNNSSKKIPGRSASRLSTGGSTDTIGPSDSGGGPTTGVGQSQLQLEMQGNQMKVTISEADLKKSMKGGTPNVKDGVDLQRLMLQSFPNQAAQIMAEGDAQKQGKIPGRQISTADVLAASAGGRKGSVTVHTLRAGEDPRKLLENVKKKAGAGGRSPSKEEGGRKKKKRVLSSEELSKTSPSKSSRADSSKGADEEEDEDVSSASSSPSSSSSSSSDSSSDSESKSSSSAEIISTGAPPLAKQGGPRGARGPPFVNVMPSVETEQSSLATLGGDSSALQQRGLAIQRTESTLSDDFSSPLSSSRKLSPRERKKKLQSTQDRVEQSRTLGSGKDTRSEKRSAFSPKRFSVHEKKKTKMDRAFREMQAIANSSFNPATGFRRPDEGRWRDSPSLSSGTEMDGQDSSEDESAFPKRTLSFRPGESFMDSDSEEDRAERQRISMQQVKRIGVSTKSVVVAGILCNMHTNAYTKSRGPPTALVTAHMTSCSQMLL